VNAVQAAENHGRVIPDLECARKLRRAPNAAKRNRTISRFRR